MSVKSPLISHFANTVAANASVYRRTGNTVNAVSLSSKACKLRLLRRLRLSFVGRPWQADAKLHDTAKLLHAR